MSRGAGPWSLAAVMSTSPFWSYDPRDTKEHPQESSESSPKSSPQGRAGGVLGAAGRLQTTALSSQQ
eukprot:scaffold106138_cov69-Phaeocystis_antarctica.AAC.3